MENFIPITSGDIFSTVLATEEQCLQHLIQYRWGGKPECPKCFSKRKVYYIKSRKAFKCSCCNSHISVRKGTIFENSNIPLRKWYKAIHKMTSKKIGKGYTAMAAMEDLDISHKSAFYMLHKIRDVMIEHNKGMDKLKGIIEADEVYTGAQLARDNKLRYKVYEAQKARIRWGLETESERKSRKIREKKWEEKTKKKYKSVESKLEEYKNTPGVIQNSGFFDLDKLESDHPKHHYKKNLVVFLQRDVKEYYTKNGRKQSKVLEYGKVVINVIGRQKEDVDMEKITPYLKKHIKKGSILITDQTGIYNGAKEIVKKHYKIKHTKDKNKKHLPIKYSKELDPKEDVYGIKHLSTNGVENVNKHIRNFDSDFIHYSYEYSVKYTYEIAFIYNCRGMSTSERFYTFLDAGLNVSRTIREIKEGVEKYSFRPKRTLNEKKKFSSYME